MCLFLVATSALFVQKDHGLGQGLVRLLGFVLGLGIALGFAVTVELSVTVRVRGLGLKYMDMVKIIRVR